jgi:hypothetical protein
MADLAEPLEFVVSLRLELGKGQSFKAALAKTLERSQGEFSNCVSNWLRTFEKGGRSPQIVSSPLRSQMLNLFDLGLQGVPVSEHLCTLEHHIKDVCAEDIEMHIEKLPVVLSLPLVFCFLPAYIVLIIGPVLSSLQLGEVTL